MLDREPAANCAAGDFDGCRGVTVRPFRPQDGESVEAILHASPEAAQWTQDAVSSLLESSSSVGSHFLVAESGGEVTGFLMARQVAGEAEILNVAVLPRFRRAGQAAALFREALKQMKSCGATGIFLEVRESNRAAIAFYEANGFSVTSRRPAYYREPEEAALCMMRKLTGFPD